MLAAMRNGRLVRALALLIALVVCVWFAVGIRQAHDTAAASEIITGSSPLRPAQARQAQSLLAAAGQLNPDRSVDLLRAQLAQRQGHLAQARAIALSVARSEPQNTNAWLAYGNASANDRLGFLVALRRLYALVPPVHGGG
jgi:hypothetical protein